MRQDTCCHFQIEITRFQNVYDIQNKIYSVLQLTVDIESLMLITNLVASVDQRFGTRIIPEDVIGISIVVTLLATFELR